MIDTNITSPDFNSYASEADLQKYATARDLTLPENLPPLLLKAMDYLEGLSWYGIRASPSQPLCWPRQDIEFDGHPFPSDQIPRQVITAQCMLAVEAVDGDLLGSSREAAVKTERVEGAVTMTYAVADGEAFIPSYPSVDALLAAFMGGRGFAINTFSERG